jgi:hypothetical protein
MQGSILDQTGQGDAERVMMAGEPELFKPGVNPHGRSEVTADVVMLALRSRFNAIRNLSPRRLSQYLDEFWLGYVAYAALVWDQMEKRDDVLRNVASKRKKAVSKLTRESNRMDSSAQSERHAKALDYFYANLTAINALDQNEAGGFPLLVRQMMDAVGKYYAVHEIIWKPGDDGLTAEFRFVPLWFFENRSGRLQFLQIPLGGANGLPLDPGAWMITKGDGLMEACSIAYMFKNMPLTDWVAYSKRFGTPGVLGRTNAAKGSVAGEAMFKAVQNIGKDYAGVIYGDDGTQKEPISFVQARGEGSLPFPPLVERMDRAMASLWRGGDLGTMSADRKGVPLQEGEGDILLDDDAMTITETLNMYVDRWVIWQQFGETPKALSRMVVPKVVNIDKDTSVARLLLEAGVPLGQKAMLNRWGFPEIRPDDDTMENPAIIQQRIVDSVSGEENPTEPKGVKVKKQATQPKAMGNVMALANALLDDQKVPAASREWLAARFQAIADAAVKHRQKKTVETEAALANEISVSIISLTKWAEEAYPSNRAAQIALQESVVRMLLTP